MKHARSSSARKRRRELARNAHGQYWRPIGFYANRPALLHSITSSGAVGSSEGFRFVTSECL